MVEEEDAVGNTLDQIRLVRRGEWSCPRFKDQDKVEEELLTRGSRPAKGSSRIASVGRCRTAAMN